MLSFALTIRGFPGLLPVPHPQTDRYGLSCSTPAIKGLHAGNTGLHAWHAGNTGLHARHAGNAKQASGDLNRVTGCPALWFSTGGTRAPREESRPQMGLAQWQIARLSSVEAEWQPIAS